MPETILDDFNRADGNVTVGEPIDWVVDITGQSYVTPDIASNVLKTDGSNAFSSVYYNSNEGPDCEWLIEFDVPPSGNGVRLYARGQSPGVSASFDAYEISVEGTNWFLVRVDNNVRTTLENLGAHGLVAGNRVKLRCVGDQISVWKDTGSGWTLVHTETDATISAAGVPGLLFQNDTVARLDDFGGGTITAGVAIGAATETDTAGALGRQKVKTLGAASEADAAGAITEYVPPPPAPSGHFAPLPPALIAEIDFIHDPLTVSFKRYMESLNLYSWYRLMEASPDTTLDDASGNGRTGSLTSSANTQYQQPDPISGEAADHAMKFSGVNRMGGKAPSGGNSGIGAGLTTGISLGLWIKPAAAPSGSGHSGKRLLFGKSGAGMPVVILREDLSLGYERTGNPPAHAFIYTNSTLTSGTGETYFVPLDEWTLVVLVVEGTLSTSWSYLYAAENGEMKLVGKAQGCVIDFPSADTPIINNMGPDPDFAGADGATYTTFTEGPFDEPFVIQRPLTVEEVNRIYVARTANEYDLTPTYEDMRPYTRKISIARGRQRELDRVEPGTQTYTLDDPDRRFEPEYPDGEYYPNVIPSRQGHTYASALEAWREATDVLTASGNEITDALRLLGVQGDARAIEDSFGVWEATTNLDDRGGFETVGSTPGWTSVNLAIFSPDSDPVRFGAQSVLCRTSAVNGYASRSVSGLTGSTQYTRSIWIYRHETASTITVQVFNNAVSATLATAAAPAVLGWSRVSVTFTTEAGQTTVVTRIACNTSGVDYNLDGAQLEQQPIATPYVETNGATATRNAALVQAPASWLDETQGWAALRVRPGWAAATDPLGAGNDVRVFSWHVDANNRIELVYEVTTNSWAARRVSGGAGAQANSAAQAFATETEHVVVMAWTATAVKVSIDGGAFVSVANSSIPTLAATTFVLGDRPANDRSLDGDILWAAFGLGVLTDADAAALHALTRDPSPSELADAAALRAVVHGDTATAALVSTADDVDLYTGFVERWPPDYISFRRTRVQVPFLDVLSSLSRWTVTGSYPSELTSARVNRVLDAIGWPEEWRRIETGFHTVIAATPDNENVLSHLQLMADSEDGILYIDPAGNIVFRNRDHRQTAYRSRVPLFVFGDSLAELPYRDPPVADYDRQRVINKVVVSFGNPTDTVEKIDWPSVEKNGELARPIATALSTEAQATTIAERVLEANKNPRLRFISMVLDYSRDPRLPAVMASLEIGDRVEVVRRPPDENDIPGDPLRREVWIERIEHTIDADRDFRWTTSLTLSPVDD